MCDFQAKLIAWLDHELLENQAAEVERHVQACEQCRAERGRYEQVSRTFDAYCAAVMAAKPHRSDRAALYLPATAYRAASGCPSGDYRRSRPDSCIGACCA